MSLVFVAAPTPRNRSPLSADIGALKRLDLKSGTAVLAPNGCWRMDGNIGGPQSITEDKTKGKVDFENCRLVSKDPAELFTEADRTDRGQA